MPYSVLRLMSLPLLLGFALLLSACSESSDPMPVTSGSIAGVVTSDNGPEAGVWVIAETEEFDTRFARIVVTDDQGRFLLPDLPAASYQLWVRGYGLQDSEKTAAVPGTADLALRALIADRPEVAAQVYPAAYWYSMLGLPSEEELATVPGGLNAYLQHAKNMTCIGCHQLGQLSTRTIPDFFSDSASSHEAWIRRMQSGQAGSVMIARTAWVMGLPFKYLSEWSDRIAAGALPSTQPERPQGLERNVVITVRDWLNPKAYLHDLSGTDRRNPTLNGYGKLYGSPELSSDDIPVLDPVANTATVFRAPVRDADTPSTHEIPVMGPSAYWGDEAIWDSKANVHNPMMDHLGRVWLTARIRGPQNPDWCGEGSANPSAQAFSTLSRPTERQLAYYVPDTGEYQFIDTCYETHHLLFAEDEDNTLWTSGGFDVVGWVNTRVLEETGSAEQAVGWSPFVLDTNGNGVRDEWVEPGEPLDPAKDMRVSQSFYAVMPNPVDGSVWGSNFNAFPSPGAITRYDPVTQLSEVYIPPLPGFGVRGADIDREGVVWVSLGSGHLGSFDRRKCRGPLNGPQATGNHCAEGWSYYDLPGPGFEELPEFSIESSYYTWVDQFNTLGLGENVPIATGNLHDGLHAKVGEEMVTLRVPYPLGFYAKGMEGRIDDADGGWKGRGIWATSGDRTPWLKENGVGTRPLVVHFQVRPDPLAD